MPPTECPGAREGDKKHPCPDCRACQFCSDRRCDLCRGWLSGRKGGEGENQDMGKDNHGK